MTVKERVSEAVRRNGMFPADCTAIVGFSGGADSTALLHVLISLREELQLAHIVAVHVDHGLRGEESLRDRTFTETFCREHNVPYELYTYNVKEIAQETGCGVEEAGRQLRYAAFSKTAEKFSTARICTAHNADDNAETVLLHLCRGCGIHGLTGIPAVRGQVVRPLLDCTRSEIEDYCRENGLDYVTDSTNCDVSYSRNRVRHEVLPSLRQINPAATRAILRLAQQAKQTESYLEESLLPYEEKLLTKQEGVFCKGVLLSMPQALQRVWLQKTVREFGIAAEEKHLSRILDLLPCEGAVSLPSGYCFRILKHTVSLSKQTTLCHDDYRILVISRKEYEQKLNNCKNCFKNVCDYDKINGELYLRHRREGDTYHPAGRGCGKSLKKLFNEKAIPPETRNAIPLLCDGLGIVIPFGMECDERVAITEATTKILVFEKTEE